MRPGTGVRQTKQHRTPFTAITGGQWYTRSYTVSDAFNGYAVWSYDYLIFIPLGYDPRLSYRTIFSCHGSGETDGGTSHLVLAGLPEFVNNNLSTFPDIVIAGVRATRDSGTPPDVRAAHIANVMYLGPLSDARQFANIDFTKLLITGYSAGAGNSSDIFIRFPNTFAALCIQAGSITTPNTAGGTNAAAIADWVASTVATKPFRDYNASDDAPTNARNLAAAMATAGIGNPPFLYTEYGAIGHGPTWTTMFADAAFWTWFRAQHL